MGETWFSAMLRFVVLIEGQGATRLSRSVYVFRAQEFPDAFERALDLGRRHEETYTGGFGEEVRVRLHSIETLDRLGSEIQDEREVYSEPTELPPGMTLAFDAEFHPESIEPTETGI